MWAVAFSKVAALVEAGLEVDGGGWWQFGGSGAVEEDETVVAEVVVAAGGPVGAAVEKDAEGMVGVAEAQAADF